MTFDRAASAAITFARRQEREAAAEKERTSFAIAFRKPAPPANDNHQPEGQHEWPARDRLKAGRLMSTPAANAKALSALLRFRADLDAVAGSESWATSGEATVDSQEVQTGFGRDVVREKVTAEHLVALHMVDELEYGTVDGHRTVCRRDGAKVYELEDRLRGERGAAAPVHPPEVAAELASRYSGALWPSDTRKPADIFMGAQMRRSREEPATFSPEDRLLHKALAARVLAFVRGGMPSGLYQVLHDAADGMTAEAIGERRGHSDKRASAVGTELMRIALEGLIECYAEYDGAIAA